MTAYRHLKKGEIIKEGDEVDMSADGYRDDPVWVKVTRRIGLPAPDPQYISHSQFRRKVERPEQ